MISKQTSVYFKLLSLQNNFAIGIWKAVLHVSSISNMEK